MSTPAAPSKNPRQVTVQPQEPKTDKGNPRVPASREDEHPRRDRGTARDERTAEDRDGLGAAKQPRR